MTRQNWDTRRDLVVDIHFDGDVERNHAGESSFGLCPLSVLLGMKNLSALGLRHFCCRDKEMQQASTESELLQLALYLQLD